MNKRELWDEVRKWVVLTAGGEGPAVGEAVQRIVAAADAYARSGAAPLSPAEFRARLAEIRSPLLAALPRDVAEKRARP